MGVASFFRGIFRGAKNGARKIFEIGKKAAGLVNRIVKPAVNIAKKGYDIYNKFGRKTISKIDEPGNNYKPIQKIDNLVDKMPDGAAKDKVKQVIDKGKNFVNDKIDKVNNVIRTVDNVTNKWAPFVTQITDKMN